MCSEECPICIENLEDDVCELMCKHKFHMKCIRQVTNRKCPICRKRAVINKKTSSNDIWFNTIENEREKIQNEFNRLQIETEPVYGTLGMMMLINEPQEVTDERTRQYINIMNINRQNINSSGGEGGMTSNDEPVYTLGGEMRLIDEPRQNTRLRAVQTEQIRVYSLNDIRTITEPRMLGGLRRIDEPEDDEQDGVRYRMYVESDIERTLRRIELVYQEGTENLRRQFGRYQRRITTPTPAPPTTQAPIVKNECCTIC